MVFLLEGTNELKRLNRSDDLRFLARKGAAVKMGSRLAKRKK